MRTALVLMAMIVVIVVLCFIDPVYSWIPPSSSILFGAGSQVISSACRGYSGNYLLYPKTIASSLSTSSLQRYGILDDYNAENTEETTIEIPTSGSDDDNNSSVYEEIFEKIVFSTSDVKQDIQDQWDICSQPGFNEWLVTQKDNTNDLEEKDAYQDLLTIIQEISDNQKKQQIEKENEIVDQVSTPVDEEETGTSGSKATSSAADVLKQANAIDQAIMTAAKDEYDDRPSDFMSDAKAERGLGGFNKQGRMRVGGG